ncbi:uncharacterized protein TrAtP1_010593 [Trichoderma atroviride]|uniref:uncharacterized protein n=1 Tax=Hypocrea atroviridis TaxID=63577 RepID=UPI00331F66F3|nr:hypothetical protein TrAtP1_010593 [Trichoderma atroviride]
MASLPKTYKAVVIDKANDPFRLRDVNLTRPSDTEVLVKVLACGVCYTDISICSGERGDVFPRVPGHELVGDVVDVGSAVKTWNIGDRVGGAFHAGHDSTCRQCRKGLVQQCENAAISGLHRDGGYAEFVLLRSEAIVRVPREMDPAEVAPLLCAGVTVFNGIRNQRVPQGALVAVQGLGGLGHLAVQYASKMGYQVVVLSSGDDKADFAKRLGARSYINTKSGGDVSAQLNDLGGADLIVQTAPSPQALTALIGGLGSNGILLSLSNVGHVDIDTGRLIAKQASIQGSRTGGPLDCEEAIQFTLDHDIHCMVDRYPFAEVGKAVDSLTAGRPRFRNVLLM